MRISTLCLVLVMIVFGGPARAASPAPWVTNKPLGGHSFALAEKGAACGIVYSPADYKLVSLVTADLATDVESVTGHRPALLTALPAGAERVVVVGTLGHSPLVDNLVASGKLEIGKLHGAWESFVICIVANPTPGVKEALVIVGSDRRGTAFGVYELSQAIGISPWHWWADVPPAKKSDLYVDSATRRFGPPSVQYRGIFINDEDWGLVPWASQTYEPETKNIGPKTYRKVFELLLRLKANTLWPAMHACSTPFNAIRENAKLADDYGIVMGSSHAEPMLRNNVGEWKAPHEQYNYVSNRDGVRAYWEERVKENAPFENLYTLGMRGIHDSGIQGAKTDAERIQILEQVFADQRAMLQKHVSPRIEQVPQLFCAYKEVLGVYRQGLKVPEDVTVMWPDDNFGYIRTFANAEERKRPGGFGIYYHLSYLGAPLSYLWLSTTPPALVWAEMSKAYESGARRIWIANVGDIKPAEIDMELFLSMAWDMSAWTPERLPHFLENWAEREFGPELSSEVAQIMAEYYRLNYQRRPEHLQWWMPKQPPRPSDLTPLEVDERLSAFATLAGKLTPLEEKLRPEQSDAFFELVAYPVRASAAANDRYFSIERYDLAVKDHNREGAALAARRARQAHDQLVKLTARFNETIAGGKWRRIMSLEPANSEWSSMRIAAPRLPPEPSDPSFTQLFSAEAPPSGKTSATLPAQNDGVVASRVAGKAEARSPGKFAQWQTILGLGRTASAATVLPTDRAPIPAEKVLEDAPRLDFEVSFPEAGNYTLTAYLVPTHPIAAGRPLQFYAGCDDGAPQRVSATAVDGSAQWARDVLNATTLASATLPVPSPGKHVVRIYGTDTGVVLDKIVVHRGELPPSYLGPETR